MKFLHGASLTQKIKDLCEASTRIDLAVAYWGSSALDILSLDPSSPYVRAVCCLKGGKSAPEVIARFGDRARQRDDLHAKVIWTENGAIVGSANASSNGLPDEEGLASGLLEAGVLVDGIPELKQVELWFNKLFNDESREITAKDLKLAALARQLPKSKKIPSLTEFIVGMRGRVPPQVSITLAIYDDPGTKEQALAIQQSKLKEESKIKRFLNINDDDFAKLDWYVNWPTLPTDEFILDCFVRAGKIAVGEFLLSFGETKEWKTKFGARSDTYHFVVKRGTKGPHCKLTGADKKAIRDCSAALQAASGRYNGLLPLSEAAPILFDYAIKSI